MTMTIPTEPSVLEEIAMFMAQLGLGDYPTPPATGGTIFLLRLPQTPDVCLAVATYTGQESDAGLPYDFPRVQVRVRGERNNTASGVRLAERVYSTMHGLGSQYLPGGTWMVQCRGWQGGAIPMGTDGNQRDEWVINFEFEIENRHARHRARTNK